jgi:hypothetical protein
MRMKVLLCLLLACAESWSVLGQGSVQVAGARIFEAGIYEARVLAAKTNASGVQLQTLDNFRLVQSTTNVPARIGIRFGFRYELFGSPSNAPVTLTLAGAHPPMTNATGKVETVFAYAFNSWIGTGFFSNTLDQPADLTPGIWTFELWYQGRRLCEQLFLVTPEKGGTTGNK